MVLAKVKIDGVDYSIASNNDIRNVEKILTIRSMINAGLAPNIQEATKLFYTKPEFYKTQYGWNKLTTKIHKLTGMV
jgi:hypothetical protein